MAESTGNMVVGFLLGLNHQRVVLVRKNHPAWQKGKLNGVGGHIEAGESPETAMVREFQEETGTVITGWEHYATMTGPNWRVYLFLAAGDLSGIEDTAAAHRMAGKAVEDILVKQVANLRYENTIGNIPWLVHLALDNGPGKPDWPIMIRYGLKQ